MYNKQKLGNFVKFKYFCVGVHVRFQCVNQYQADLISKRTVMSVNNGRCINHSYIWVDCVYIKSPNHSTYENM